MEKFDYRKILESGKEYECGISKNGVVDIFHIVNGFTHMCTFNDTFHNDYLSYKSFFVLPEQIILEVKNINYINFKTGYVFFTGRIKPE